MDIDVQIERLVLDGIDVPHAQRPLLQAAVETELTRLLTEGGISAELQPGGALPSVPAHAITLDDKADPARLGRQIARSVYSGIGGQE